MQEKIPDPTVGRIVWFYEKPDSTPLPAIVVATLYGHTIDLTVFGLNGMPAELVFSVPHKEDRDYRIWDWMPYQKGQAAKTEQLQAELEEKAREHSKRMSERRWDEQGKLVDGER